MPNAVIEKIPAAAVLFDDFNFTDDLPGDTSITRAVTAVDSAGTAAASVVGTVAGSGMVVTAVCQAGTNGEDYLLDFKATGVTTGQIVIKQLEMRVRTKVTGAM